jgi:hypothetical protein
MLDSALLFVCVAINTGLIGHYLVPRLLTSVARLAVGLRRSRRYLGCRLSENREQAFRGRTLRLLRRLLLSIALLIAICASYSPSMLFAACRLRLADAFVSMEAIGGMLAAALVLALQRSKP